jgi:hypothetical protein
VPAGPQGSRRALEGRLETAAYAGVALGVELELLLESEDEEVEEDEFDELDESDPAVEAAGTVAEEEPARESVR